MEFNTYIGRAGTGKSTAMLNQIKNKMKQDPLGDPIVLIAPTQSTFQLEQAFVNDSELHGSLRTEVLHFERLSHRVFQEVAIQTRTKHKLEDISLIYKQLESRMNGEFITTEDSLQQFIEILSQSQWIKRLKYLLMDSIIFSTLEYRIIEHLFTPNR